MIDNITIDCNHEREFSQLTTALKENNGDYRDINLINITNQKLHQLCESLIGNNSLLSLNLSKNDLNANEAKTIANALISNKTLQTLDLSYNNIQDEGAQAIAELLELNKSLKLLFIQGNTISEAGANYISSSLSKNTSLKELNISRNPIKDEGVKKIADALKTNNSLISITLYCHNGTEACYDYIKEHLFPNNKTILEFIPNTNIRAPQNKPLHEWLKNNKTELKKSLGSFTDENKSLPKHHVNMLYNSHLDIFGMLFAPTDIDKFRGSLFARCMQYFPPLYNRSKDINFYQYISQYYDVQDKTRFINTYQIFMQIDMLASSHNIKGILTRHNLLFINDGLNKGVTPPDINSNLENILNNEKAKSFIMQNLRTAGYLMCLEESRLNSFIEIISNTAINQIASNDYSKIPAFINSYELIKAKSEICSSIKDMKSMSSKTFKDRYQSELLATQNENHLSPAL